MKERHRVRILTGESRDGAWEHVDPEKRIPIPLALHWWSNWKGLSRQDWLLSDTRLVRTTDDSIKEWAMAFIAIHLVFVPCSDDCLECFEYRDDLATQEHDLWEVLEERMQKSDPKTAYQIAAGMAMEMHNAMPNHEREYNFKMETAYKDRFYYIYTYFFGHPEKPRRKVFY